MNIRVDLSYPVKDGAEVVFRSPVDCSQVTGLKVYYVGADGNTGSQEFAFADAHGNNVGDIDHLFAEDVVVKVILDVTKSMAFVQNADTNAYLEGRFNEKVGYEAEKTLDMNGHSIQRIYSLIVGEPGGNKAEFSIFPYRDDDGYEGARFLDSEGEQARLGNIREGVKDTDAVNKGQMERALSATEMAMVDKLCPAFTESGAIVTCEPVEGYSLQVVSKINAAQEGEGDPTPNNIRPLVKHTAVQLSQSNGQEQLTYAFDFGRTVYGGTLDWSTGILSIEWVIEEITKCTSVNYAGFANINTAKKYQYDGKGVYHKCSHYVAEKYTSSYPNNYSYAANDNLIVMIDYTHFGTKESADAYLAAQKAAGTPVQICYKLTSPTKVQLTPQEVKALAGVNTIYSDTGDTIVTGKANPAAEIEKLKNAILAMGGNV